MPLNIPEKQTGDQLAASEFNEVVDYINTLDTELDNAEAAIQGKQDANSALDNVSGTNTGDETTNTIQTKRPLKTINGESLEGTGNIVAGGGGGSTIIVDNLESTATDEALSANMGNNLKSQIDAISSGSGNPNIFIPTTAADFTNPSVGNANKTWEIQSAIDTGSSDIDFTGIEGVTLHFRGGSLTGSGTITGNGDTNITGDRIDKAYFSNDYTFAGKWEVTDIAFNWFELVSDAESSKFDNRQAVKNALLVANTSGHCKVNWYNTQPDSEWFVSAVSFGGQGEVESNTNYGIFNTTHVDVIGHNFPKVHALDNENTGAGGASLRSTIFQFFEAQYCSISGFELIGDRDTATYLPEHKMGVVFSNNSDFSKAYGNKIHSFSGDAIYFLNQRYSGYGQIPIQTDSEWTLGSISEVDGTLDATDTEFMSSNAFLDIDTPYFQDRGWLYVEGRMDIENYFLSYYDENQTFIGKTLALEPYDRVYFPEGTKSVKITMWQEDALDTNRPIRIFSHDYSRYITIENNEIYNCSRQGLSNAPHYTRIIGNKFYNIWGQAAGPCAAIDLEDGGYYTAYVEIIGNTFLNTSGSSLLLKYNRHILVKDNWFGSTDYVEDGSYSYYGDFEGGYYAQHSPGTIVSNNTFIGRSAVIGRDQTFTGNYMKNTTISLEKGRSNVIGNTMSNVRILSVSDDYTYIGRPQLINNHFEYPKPFNWDVEASYVFNVKGRYDQRGNTYDLKNNSDGVTRTIVAPPTLTSKDSGTGFLDGETITGYKGTSSYGFGGYNMVDIYNSSFSCGYYNKDQATTPRDVLIKNTTFKQYAHEDPRTYNDTNLPTIDDYKTITYDGVTIIYDDASFTRSMLDIESWNFNIVFKNCKFISKVPVTNVRFIDIDNKGTVLFDGCTFDNFESETYDFSFSQTSKATVINCVMRNTTLTPRTGDVFKNNLVDGVFVE